MQLVVVLIDQRDDGLVQFVGRDVAEAERALRADGPAAPVGVDRTRVAVVGQGMQPATRRPPEHRDQGALRDPGHLADRGDPPPA